MGFSHSGIKINKEVDKSVKETTPQNSIFFNFSSAGVNEHVIQGTGNKS